MLAYFRKCRFLSALLVSTMLSLSLQPLAQASMVGTDELLLQQQTEFERETLITAIDREEVRQVLVQHGVDPQQAKERIASLTDDELQAVKQKFDEMPAGGSIGGVILTIFLVLLLTDILGYTDVFPFVKKHK